MKRLVLENLLDWKNSTNRKPLIIRGARQVGKTFTVKEFGDQHFSGQCHVVDLEKYPDWIRVFEKDLDPDRIKNELAVLLDQTIKPGKDLLFIDEIQHSPRAIMALRYFYEDLPDLHVIAAGSLLEFALKEISFPVGRVQMMTMYPMNFMEFLMALKKGNAVALLRSDPQNLSEPVHDMLLNYMRNYMFVGGMPECVKVWRDKQSLTEVFAVQRDLVNTYRQDFSKYAPYVDKRSLNQVLTNVSKNIGKQTIYSRLSADFTGPTNKKAFELLMDARVITKVKATAVSSLPLGESVSDRKFKSFLVDIGLMRTLSDMPANMEYQKTDLMSLYNGALAEHFVGQELLSSGFEQLYYWSRDAKSSSAEVDYLIVKDGKICPIEVKSGASGKLRSLHQLLKDYPNIEQGYVLSTVPFGSIPEQKLTFLPLYYAWRLAQG